MIKTINAGAGIRIQNGYAPATYVNMSNASAGMIRYNGNSNNMEVYDGSSWMSLTGAYPMIELDGDVLAVVNWAKEKMNKEAKIQELAKTNPTVADALAAFEKAQEQLDIVATLTAV
jgi:hypothetical protein